MLTTETAATQPAPPPSGRKFGFARALQGFETIIVATLIVMMAVVILISTLELGWMIIKDLTSPPFVLLSIHQLLEILSLFLLIFIGIELLATMKTYFTDHTLHVEIVLQVALISIARKIVVLEIQDPTALHLFGFAALLVALAATYYLETRVRHQPNLPDGASKS
jgi:uncharacterized membrane protein (DUF373 family)